MPLAFLKNTKNKKTSVLITKCISSSPGSFSLENHFFLTQFVLPWVLGITISMTKETHWTVIQFPSSLKGVDGTQDYDALAHLVG